MRFTNTRDSFGLLSILIHWVTAFAVLGLTVLGLWMVDLDYYSEWYQTGPDIHRSVGVLMAIALILRVGWRFVSPPPRALEEHLAWERRSAIAMHWVLMLLLWAVIVTGYLISSADGRAVEVFDWFSVPATLTSIPDQEELAGDVHFILAMVLLGFAALHALAALKHHFRDRDRTLTRMFGR